MLKSMIVILAALQILPAAMAQAAPWKLSPETTVTVSVDWKGETIPVKFPTLSGDIEFDQNAVSSARATINVATADATTGVAPVDALVHSADYLDVAHYPQITFQLDKLIQTSKTEADIFGRVTLRGVTKPATFHATVFRFGPSKDDPERFEAGFDLTGSIDRTDFGSTGGLPYVAAVLPVRIHLLMSSK